MSLGLRDLSFNVEFVHIQTQLLWAIPPPPTTSVAPLVSAVLLQHSAKTIEFKKTPHTIKPPCSSIFPQTRLPAETVNWSRDPASHDVGELGD